MNNEPLGTGSDGAAVYLKDLWPSQQEVNEVVAASVKSEMFRDKYADVFSGSSMWKEIKISEGDLLQWSEESTYIHHPPYFQSLTLDVPSVSEIKGARVFGLFGDSITTDHISPAGNIAGFRQNATRTCDRKLLNWRCSCRRSATATAFRAAWTEVRAMSPEQATASCLNGWRTMALRTLLDTIF